MKTQLTYFVFLTLFFLMQPAFANTGGSNNRKSINSGTGEAGGAIGNYSPEIAYMCSFVLGAPWTTTSIGAANGGAMSNVCDNAIDISSNGYSPSLTSDAMIFAHQNLCGNQTVTVKVNNISNGGFAGIMFRETTASGSKMVAIKTQLNNSLHREVRSVTNGAKIIQQAPAVGHSWLRLVRNGNNFSGFRSNNGTSWQFAFTVTVAMTSCMQVGLFTQGLNQSSNSTANFGDISGFPTGPANDACANATPIACGGSAMGSTVTATIDGPGSDCGGGSVAPDVWYTITGTGNNITASLCGSGYDTQIDVYTGSCGALANIGGCNDDFCGVQSQMTWASTLGVVYRIRVHGFSGSTGSFTLVMTCAPLPPGTANPPYFEGEDFVNDMTRLDFVLFPNPAQSEINVKLGNEFIGKDVTVFVSNQLGQTVITHRIQEVQSHTERLQLNNLPGGLYILSLQTAGHKLISKKFVVGDNRP